MMEKQVKKMHGALALVLTGLIAGQDSTARPGRPAANERGPELWLTRP